MTFAEKIKKLRKNLSMTQAALAVLLKTSQSSVACWELGLTECKPETRERLEKLCTKKGFKINWRK